mgnify:CR=1 FL=1
MHFRRRIAGTVLLLLVPRRPPPAACQAAPSGSTSSRRPGASEVSRVSPDGRWLVYTVGTPDVEENRTRVRALARSPLPARRAAPPDLRREARFGSRRSRPTDRGSRSSPTATADRRSIVIDSDRRRAGRRRPRFRPTSTASGGPRTGSGSSSPSDVFPDCPDAACDEQEVQGARKSKTKARVAERLLFRHWDSWKDGLRTHVWKAPVSGPASARRGPDSRRPGRAALLRRRRRRLRRLARTGRTSSSRRTPTRSKRLSTNGDIWSRRSMGAGKARDLTEANKAYDGTPKFSPDGKWIAWRSQKRPGFEADKFTLVVYDRAARKARALTEDFDQWVEAFTWAPDSRSLYLHFPRRRRAARSSGGPATESPRRSGAEGRLPASSSRDGRRLVFSSSSLSRAPEIWSAGSDGKERAPVTHVNDALWKEVEMGEVSERTTRSADGRNLQAWLVKPPGFDPSKKYPAVLLHPRRPAGRLDRRLVHALEPAGLGGLRLRRLRRQPARLDRLRPEVPGRDLAATGAGRSTTT